MRLYPILQPVVKAIITPLWRPTVSGNHHIPASGGVVLACNHQAALETYFVPCLITREVHWLGKDGLFKGKGIPGKFFAWLMASVNVIPVDRTGSGRANAALETGIRILNEGKLLGVFPEGTRSPDGRMYKGKTGAVRLALATGAPIVPVAILGAFEAQKPGSVLPRMGSRMHADIGAPIDIRVRLDALREKTGQGRDEPVSRDELHTLTRHVMEQIRLMSHQEYVDEYASAVKRRLAAAKEDPEADTRIGTLPADGPLGSLGSDDSRGARESEGLAGSGTSV